MVMDDFASDDTQPLALLYAKDPTELAEAEVRRMVRLDGLDLAAEREGKALEGLGQAKADHRLLQWYAGFRE